MDKNCDTCFYARSNSSGYSPCSRCSDFDKYAMDSRLFWYEESKVDPVVYDSVNKPKHYMLFPEHNIEVRDVIQQLVKKLDNSVEYAVSGMDAADYVQAMQYFMRFMEKNGKEDLEKGVWYINKMIENWGN